MPHICKKLKKLIVVHRGTAKCALTLIRNLIFFKGEKRAVIVEWIFPMNLGFDVHGFFRNHRVLDTDCTNKVEVGDIAYIYISSPEQAIRYKCKVIDISKEYTTIDDSVYNGNPSGTYYTGIATIELLEKYEKPGITLSELRAHGINPNFSMQNKIRVPAETLKYIEGRVPELKMEHGWERNEKEIKSWIYSADSQDAFTLFRNDDVFETLPCDKKIQIDDIVYIAIDGFVRYKCLVENLLKHKYYSNRIKNNSHSKHISQPDSIVIQLETSYKDPCVSLVSLRAYSDDFYVENGNSILLVPKEIEFIEKRKSNPEKDNPQEETHYNDSEIGKNLDALPGEEREAVIKQRVNQSDFRKNLLTKYGKCALCGVSNKSLLLASHIKPWAKSEPCERTEVENGLLLCPNHDRLFDKGFISFDRNGNIMISRVLSETDKMFLNINEDMHVHMSEKMKSFMAYHRKNIFKSGSL